MTDLMIDLETMGTTPGCALVSIGAVRFDLDADGWPQDMRHEFYARVSLPSCQRAGLTLEAETLEWWMERAARWPKNDRPVALAAALGQLSFFVEYGQPAVRRVWGHGAAFDPPILAAAYRAAGVARPWQYTQVRDTRTLLEAAGLPTSFPEATHHALEDARVQARAVQQAMRQLRGAAP